MPPSISSPPSPTSRPHMIFRSISFYLALVGIVLAVVLVRRVSNKPSAPGPVSPPARSPYAASLAASGLIEARGENVRIASQKPGVVAKVFVKVGDSIAAGAPLFQLNDRESRALLATKEAELDSLKAAALTRGVLLRDAEDQLQRGRKLRQAGVITEEEINQRLFAAERAKAELVSAESQVEAATAQRDLAQTTLDLLTVRAPSDGHVLQVNVRPGEFASASTTEEPLLLLNTGGDDRLQVRADIDEQTAIDFTPGTSAVGAIKGRSDWTVPLRFVRVEPYVVPKRSLTGDSFERVDTRVLQVIYEFDRPTFPIYVGQQVDVFIERAQKDGGTSTPPGTALR